MVYFTSYLNDMKSQFMSFSLQTGKKNAILILIHIFDTKNQFLICQTAY